MFQTINVMFSFFINANLVCGNFQLNQYMNLDVDYDRRQLDIHTHTCARISDWQRLVDCLGGSPSKDWIAYHMVECF